MSLGIPGTRATARSAKKMWIIALAWSLARTRRTISRSFLQPWSKGSVVAASSASSAASGAVWLRRILPAWARPAAKIAAFSVGDPSPFLFAGLSYRLTRNFAREPYRAGQQFPINHPVDQPHLQRLRSLDRSPRNAHLDRRGDAHQARQALRALGARNDAEIHFGRAQRRVRNRHAIVSRHGDLEAPA